VGKAALNVFSGDVRVGRLVRSDVEEDEILFTYISDCTPQRAVSLTMPVRVDQYDAMGGLLPIFEMDAAATSAASRGDATPPMVRGDQKRSPTIFSLRAHSAFAASGSRA
jgi:hypothetical protein